MSIGDIKILDATGLICPEPVMLLHKAIRNMAVGDRIKVVATDPSTQRDVPRFCDFLNHQLLLETEEDGQFTYLIQKGAKPDQVG